MNNDGKAGEGNDSSLKTAALQSGASDEAKEKGTEYLFVNDQLSNGLWDKEDSDSTKPASENKDDDLTELKTICAATFGGIWFEFEGGDIAKLEFWKNKECTEEVTFPFALSESNKLPEKLYVRTKGDWTEEVEGKLIMKFGKADKSETWADDKLLFTVVKHLGDKHYFQAADDYIGENNTRFCVREKAYGSAKFRIVSMRNDKTKMYPIDAARRPGGAQLKGIDAVVAQYSDISVVVNGNQCFFADDRNAYLAGLNGEMTDKCHGRIVRFGQLDVAVSSDNYDTTTSPAGSELAAPEPIPGMSPTDPNSRGGNYVAQYDAQKKFVLAAGQVPLGSGAPDQPAGNPDAAMGGLSANAARRQTGGEVQSIGIAPITSDGKEMLFVASQSAGGGHGGDLAADAKKSRVKDLPGGRTGEMQLLFLDGSTSVALAHMNGADTLKTVIKGAKHTGSPYYYVNTYLLFRCEKPRP